MVADKKDLYVARVLGEATKLRLLADQAAHAGSDSRRTISPHRADRRDQAQRQRYDPTALAPNAAPTTIGFTRSEAA